MNDARALTLALPDGVSSVGSSLNQRCSVHNEHGVHVIWVDGQAWMTFDEDDLAARRLAMALLSMHQVATGPQIAAGFGVGTATVERACAAFRRDGVAGLVPRRRPGRAPRVRGSRMDAAILAAKRAGQSVRAIAGKFGVSRTAVDTSLARSGWKPEVDQLSLDVVAHSAASEASIDLEQAAGPAWESEEHAGSAGQHEPSGTAQVPSEPQDLPVELSADNDPSNRSIDRLLARQGSLNDAAPLFEDADGVCDVGAMLAMAVLVQQGVFVEAMKVFHGIGPAFYGLRTVIACFGLLMVLNLGQLQDVMQREPGALGRLLGLDRSPEIKTLRRKLRALAAQGRSLAFMEALARRQLASEQHVWAYIDGHVSVYSGKHKLREHHVASLRAARPSVIDYWVNQPDGSPLLVITGAAREGLVRQIRTVRQQLGILAPDKPVTLVFDREGWSPQLFAQLAADPGVRFLSYRKAAKGKKLPQLPLSKFRTVEHTIDGRSVCYELADERIRIPYEARKRAHKTLVLRQITRRTPNGRQVHIVTDDFQSPAVELAYRMIHRWSQENFFKYDQEHRDIDALVTHATEPAADADRAVPNPQRVALGASIREVRSKLEEALCELGERQLGPDTESESLRAYIEALRAELARLQARRDATPARVPFSTTDKGCDAVQPRVETRRLMHCFRILGARADLALLELIRPHFPDWRHEGRALVRAILHSSGNIRVGDRTLHIEIAPQASPYKTRALEQLCAAVSAMGSVFPGTDLLMSFAVLPGRSPS